MFGNNPRLRPVQYPRQQDTETTLRRHREALRQALVLGPGGPGWQTSKDALAGMVGAAGVTRIVAAAAPGLALAAPLPTTITSLAGLAAGVVLGRGVYAVRRVDGDVSTPGALTERLAVCPEYPPRRTTRSALRQALPPRLRGMPTPDAEAERMAQTLNETAFAAANTFLGLSQQDLAQMNATRCALEMATFVEPFLVALLAAHYGVGRSGALDAVPSLVPAILGWNFEPHAYVVSPLLLRRSIPPRLWPLGSLSTPYTATP